MGSKRGTRKSERGTGPPVPRSAFPLPRSIEDVRLLRGLRRREAKVSIRRRGGAPAAGRPGEEPLLHQEWLVHFLQGARVLPDRGGDRLDPDGTALEHLDDRLEDARIHVVEPRSEER